LLGGRPPLPVSGQACVGEGCGGDGGVGGQSPSWSMTQMGQSIGSMSNFFRKGPAHVAHHAHGVRFGTTKLASANEAARGERHEPPCCKAVLGPTVRRRAVGCCANSAATFPALLPRPAICGCSRANVPEGEEREGMLMEVAPSEISSLFLIRTCHLAADGFPSTRLFGP
jgi:hypothetical protein